MLNFTYTGEHGIPVGDWHSQQRHYRRILNDAFCDVIGCHIYDTTAHAPLIC